MSQAKTLNHKELRRVLDYVATRPHAARNRLMLQMTHLAGMRIGEVAALLVRDVVAADGVVKAEIRLAPEQTKGKHARTVFVSDRLRKEIGVYIKTLDKAQTHLFATQKQPGFSANSACQLLNAIYQRAGIDGASSHSGRRSFITTLANKGVGVRVLAALAGHRSISTTQKYIDVNDVMQRAAVELI